MQTCILLAASLAPGEESSPKLMHPFLKAGRYLGSYKKASWRYVHTCQARNSIFKRTKNVYMLIADRKRGNT